MLLFSETKITNTFPVSQFCVPEYSYHSDLTVQEIEAVLCYMYKEHIPCIMLSKFTFEK